MNNIDKRRGKLYYENDHLMVFEIIVWCVTLKREAKMVYLKNRRGTGHTVFLSTDTNMDGKKTMPYYGLRFQIEFATRRKTICRSGRMPGS